MQILFPALLCASALVITPVWADDSEEEPSRVTVEWVDEDSYTDFETAFGYGNTTGIKRQLEEFFERASRRLPEDVTVDIKVLAVDLAGEFHPTATRDVRIVRDPYWPSFRFAYTVKDADGETILEGEKKEWGFKTPASTTETYKFEQALIRDFMRHLEREIEKARGDTEA